MDDLDLDVLANSVRMNLDERPIRRIAIDSLAELVLADREWDRFPAYMRSLVGLVRAAGVSFLATSETVGATITSQSLEGLMFLFDNVIDLRYIEEGSGLGRAINIVKMRNRAHAMTLNQVTISDTGIAVGDTIEGVTGRLGWSALRTQDPRAGI
jgi:circadian clock protein KaiC